MVVLLIDGLRRLLLFLPALCAPVFVVVLVLCRRFFFVYVVVSFVYVLASSVRSYVLFVLI